MADAIDFRVSDNLAVGHDRLNTIIFRAYRAPVERTLQFEGQSWRPVRFIFMDKAVLVRDLRELGCPRPLEVPQIALMPSDLREWRAGFYAPAGT